MKTVDLKILSNRLSEYVRLAEHGETVLVTDRDRVAAEISPPRHVPMVPFAQLMGDLAADRADRSGR